MARLLRALGWLVVVVVVAALAAVAAWPAPAAVDVATVERGPLSVTIDEEGETRLRQRFVVSAPIACRVLRITLEPGDRVRRGETIIATLLPSTPQPLDARTLQETQAAVARADAALDRAEAERRRAQSALELERSELARERELHENALTSRQQLETREASVQAAQDTLAAAEAAVRAALHERDMLQARLIVPSPSDQQPGALVVRSPIDGVVVRRYRDSEATVPAGEPLVELGDPRDIEIVADLLSTDAVKVRPGHRVIIDRWGGDRPLAGRVRRVEPGGFTKISALGVEEQRVNVVIDIDDDAGAGGVLGSGYRVEVRIVVWEDLDVVKAPAATLFRFGEQWNVFLVDGDRAHRRGVQIGRRNGTEAEVVAGLRAGDRLIVHPTDAVTDGARVRPRSAGQD